MLEQAAQSLREHVDQRWVEISDRVLSRALRATRTSLAVQARAPSGPVHISEQVLITYIRDAISTVPDVKIQDVVITTEGLDTYAGLTITISARRRRRPIVGEDWVLTLPAGPDTDPVARAQHEELRVALEAALGELPWRQRASWLLRELEGLSYEEIADTLNTSPTVIRGQLHRARGTLAVRMAQWR